MKRYTALFILTLLAQGGFVFGSVKHPEALVKKTIYGYIEKATLMDKNLTLSSKLDTGAKSASLSAIHISEFEQEGERYLHFTVPSKQGDVQFTSKYVGKVKIKMRPTEKKSAHLIKRPVVLINIRLGDKIREIPVNLTNRKRFLYPLLLGRDAIKAFSGIVDPSTTFLQTKK